MPTQRLAIASEVENIPVAVVVADVGAPWGHLSPRPDESGPADFELRSPVFVYVYKWRLQGSWVTGAVGVFTV